MFKMAILDVFRYVGDKPGLAEQVKNLYKQIYGECVIPKPTAILKIQAFKTHSPVNACILMQFLEHKNY